MVGAYPDPPNHRVAWDRDGSTLIEYDSDNDVIYERTEGDREASNDESTAATGYSSGSSNGYWIVLFPEPVTITHYTLVISDTTNVSPDSIEVSADTTNGKDGTWTVVDDNPPATTDVTIWRDGWREITGADGIVGIRYQHGHARRARPRIFHLYGTYDTPPPPALALWDPDSDQRITAASLDWGDVQRGTTATKRFRVKNLSGTDMAEGVTLSDEALTDGSPTNVGQHDFSDDDGASFADPLDIGDLDPGEISGELLLRRDMANDADLGVWALRVLAQATAWSEVS